jgi:HlyD family secretion protein
MCRKRGFLIGVAACLLLVITIVGAFSVRGQLAAAQAPGNPVQKVERGEIRVQVIESGAIHARRVVEVRSRVSGRVARLLVDEGDTVARGQLIAVIDPQETELRVEQDRAQLRGAKSAVARTSIEMEQRRVAAQARLDQARARVAQLEKEYQAQPALTEASIEAAESALSVATQALDQLVRVTQANERTAVETALRDAEHQLANAEREAQRRAELLAQGFVSEREKQAADLELSLARTRVSAAQDRMDRLPGQQEIELRTAEERVRQARAELERAEAGRIQPEIKAQELASARAALRDALAGLRDVDALAHSRAQSQAQVDQIGSVLRDSERQLKETEIRSPIDGVVTNKLIQVGELVASLSSFSAGTPIVRIEDRSAMVVKMNINEIDVAKLRIGMPVEVAVDAIRDRRFSGRVSKISPSSTAAEGQAHGADPVVRYAVEVTLDGQDPALKSGMTARCTMVALRRSNVLVLPSDFVGREGGVRFVMVAPPPEAQGREAQRREVRVGAETAALVEIVSGVEEGVTVERPAFTGPRRRGMVIGAEGKSI